MPAGMLIASISSPDGDSVAVGFTSGAEVPMAVKGPP